MGFLLIIIGIIILLTGLYLQLSIKNEEPTKSINCEKETLMKYPVGRPPYYAWIRSPDMVGIEWNIIGKFYEISDAIESTKNEVNKINGSYKAMVVDGNDNDVYVIDGKTYNYFKIN